MWKQQLSTPMWNDAAGFVGLSLTDNRRAAFTTHRLATFRSSRPWPTLFVHS